MPLMSRRLTTMFYLREIPMLMKHTQEHGDGIGGVLAGGKDMLLSKMLFEPFKELWNNRSYFGSEIWDTNAPGYQQVQQALRHIVSQQLSHVAPGARPYQDEANTHERLVARNNLLLAQRAATLIRSRLPSKLQSLQD